MTTDGVTDIQKYRISLSGVASTMVEVQVNLSELEEGEEAIDRAIDMAYDANRVRLCHQCSHNLNLPNEWTPGNWTVDESHKAVMKNVTEVD